MRLPPMLRWIGLALLGIAVAAGVAIAASQLASRQIGLASEPISAGDALAPAKLSPAHRHAAPRPPRHPAKPEKGTPTVPTAPTVPAPPPATTTPPPSPPPPRESTSRSGGGDGEHHGGGGGHADD